MEYRVYTVLAGLLLAGCAGKDTQPEVELRPSVSGQTLVYECGDTEFTARVGGQEMELWLDDRQVLLARVRSASGEKYEGEDVQVWHKGEEASLVVDGQHYASCRLAPERGPWEDARRRGVDFRAVGNGSGWVLEIQHDRHMMFVSDTGMNRVMTPDPGAEEEAGQMVYHAVTEGNDLRVEISQELCVDTVSGDSFSSQVSVELNGKQLQGCGSSLVGDWQ